MPSAKKGGGVPAKGKGPKPKKRKRDEQVDSESDEAEGVSDLDEEEDLDLTSAGARLVPPPPTTSGTVLITLRTTTPYSLWSLPHLGSRGPLLAPSILPRPLPKTPQPTFAVVRSFEFDPTDWEGYEHRRTIGYKAGVSSEKNDDLTLTARERGEKKRAEKEEKDRQEKEERDGAEANRRGGKALIRTWEFECVKSGAADPSGDRDYE